MNYINTKRHIFSVKILIYKQGSTKKIKVWNEYKTIININDIHHLQKKTLNINPKKYKTQKKNLLK